MTEENKLVSIVMGSRHDWDTLIHAANILDQLNINYEVEVVSAHRTPDKLFSYAENAKSRHIEVIIAGAGGAAHLPGMLAAKTSLPILGVPIQSKILNGIDSLLSIVQMPAGIPVATLAIGQAGATNAALLAAAILANKYIDIDDALIRFRKEQTHQVLSHPDPRENSMKIGILGGGQLARMLALSGHPLGIDCICIDPKIDSSAKKVTKVIHCDFNDLDEINRHFHDVDCVTYETENLPIDCVEVISKKYKLLPGIDVLKISQDRLFEKNFLSGLTIPTAQYIQVDTWNDLKNAIDIFNFPLVLKTRRNGYDGKGQAVIRNFNEAESAWKLMSAHALIVEKFIPYRFEISLISVRSNSGDILFYPLTLNQHKNGILQVSEAPYHDDKLKNIAEKYAVKILEKFNYVGVLTIEFFCIDDGLIVNEIAPRVHNSGHWTIEGAATSQFENHLRAIAGLQLGSTEVKTFNLMVNCIGNIPEVNKLLVNFPNLYLHDYQKTHVVNRKVGHLTFSCNNPTELNEFKQAIKKHFLTQNRSCL